jgi:hypothetical protein
MLLPSGVSRPSGGPQGNREVVIVILAMSFVMAGLLRYTRQQWCPMAPRACLPVEERRDASVAATPRPSTWPSQGGDWRQGINPLADESQAPWAAEPSLDLDGLAPAGQMDAWIEPALPSGSIELPGNLAYPFGQSPTPDPWADLEGGFMETPPLPDPFGGSDGVVPGPGGTEVSTPPYPGPAALGTVPAAAYPAPFP